MRQKHCVLVQAHKSIPYIFNLAKLNPNVNFYIHFDKKSDINIISGGVCGGGLLKT